MSSKLRRPQSATRSAPKIAVSTGSFYDLDIPTEIAVEHIAAARVDDIEIFLQGPSEMGLDFTKNLADRCRDLGVTVGSVHPYVFGFENLLFTRYQRQRRWATDQYCRYLDICAELGAPYYVSHGPPRHHVLHHGRLSEDYRSRTVELAALAATRGVTFCMENVSYGLVRDVEDLALHLGALSVPFVLDFKSAWKAGDAPESFIARFSAHLVFAHVSFNDRRNGRFGVCAPRGTPDHEVASALRAFQTGAAEARMVIEVCEAQTVADIERSICALRRFVEPSQHT